MPSKITPGRKNPNIVFFLSESGYILFFFLLYIFFYILILLSIACRQIVEMLVTLRAFTLRFACHFLKLIIVIQRKYGKFRVCLPCHFTCQFKVIYSRSCLSNCQSCLFCYFSIAWNQAATWNFDAVPYWRANACRQNQVQINIFCWWIIVPFPRQHRTP